MYGSAGSSSRRVAWRRPTTAASGGGGGGGGGGGVIFDPRQMPRSLNPNAFLNDATNNANGTTFWTNVANNGVQVDTDFSAGVYKTILNVSGAGDLLHVIGPAVLNGQVVTFEITVDSGSAIEVAVTAAVDAQRALIGYRGAGGTSGNVNAAMAGLAGSTLDAAKRVLTTGEASIPAPMDMRSRGQPRLRFGSSILVRIRSSAAVTGTGACERRSGAVYIMD